jgi:cytochrome c-type biogenesis protein CcmH/NrfG
MKHIHTFESFLNEVESNKITVKLSTQAAKSMASELKSNGVKFTTIRPTVFELDDTPKARMAIKMAKERFGARDVLVESNNEESAEEINEDSAHTLYAILMAANATAAVSYALHSAGGGEFTPIQDLKNWWAKRKKDKAVQSIVSKLKDDPEVIAFMNLTDKAQRGKWYKLIEPKLSDEEKQYLRSISKSSFK